MLLNRDGAFIRQPAIGSHAIDRTRQMLAELRQKVLRRHASLTRHVPHLAFAQNALQLLRRDRLVGPVANPGLRNMAETRLLHRIGVPNPWRSR